MSLKRSITNCTKISKLFNLYINELRLINYKELLQLDLTRGEIKSYSNNFPLSRFLDKNDFKLNNCIFYFKQIIVNISR